MSEEGQKTIKEEGRKEEYRQEVEAKQFSESKRKFKRTSSKCSFKFCRCFVDSILKQKATTNSNNNKLTTRVL